MNNNEFKPKSYKIYFFTFLFSVAVILLVCGINGLFTEDVGAQDTVKYVSDAFFVAGVLTLGMAGLTFGSKQGAFDGLGYAVSSFFDTRKPSTKRLNWSKKETYEEYVERKHSKDDRKKVKHLLIIGGAMMVIAIVMYIVYKFAF